jgi:predicted metalloprotease with PDZ domain
VGKGRGANFIYSLGVSVDGSGKVGEVRWDSPAFNAGIGTGMQLVAVNGLQYSATELEEAVCAAKDSAEPITLLVKELDTYRTLQIDYHDGLRYPHLERVEGTRDYLTPIFTARK